MNADQLIDRLVTLYDVETSRANDVLNERLTRMAVDSEIIRSIQSLGTTTADTSTYTLASNVARVLKAYATYSTGQLNYEAAETPEALFDIDAGVAEAGSSDAFIVVYPDSDADSTTSSFRLYPTPTESGVTVYGLVVLEPASITYGSSTALPVPLAVHQHLLAGCKAELSDESERQDESAKFEAVFQQGVQALVKRVNSRGRGSGPHRMRVAGYDFNRGPLPPLSPGVY